MFLPPLLTSQLQEIADISPTLSGAPDTFAHSVIGIALALIVFLAIVKIYRLWERKRFLDRKEQPYVGTVDLRDITNALPSRVSYIDRDGILIFSNREDYAKHCGQPLCDLVDSAMREQYKVHFEACLAGESVSMERSGGANGCRIEQVQLLPHRNDKGEILGAIVVATDITAYRNTQIELSLAKDLADSANATKSAFLAHMSHEIRTPLGAVLGFSDLLAQSNLSPTERERYVGAIRRNGDLLNSLIDDILDISKVESGNMTLEIQALSLEAILADIRAHLWVQAEVKHTDIIITRPPGLPRDIHSDPTRLRQILINIVGNAVKFTERGRVEVVLEMLSSTLLAFHVRDSGCGIAADHAADLFKPFHQGDPSIKRQYGGTGLGLALSRRLARMLGGDVVLARSRPGEGSVFTITIDTALPLSQHRDSGRDGERERRGEREEEREAGDDQRAFAIDLEPENLRGVHVLIVEDALDNQLLIGTYLESAGAIYDIANNGVEALAKIQQIGFDVVIMDIQMPLMDGYETAATLRRQGYDIPLVALTAHTMREERDKCLAHGFDDHVGKPINPERLLRSIKTLVSQAPKSPSTYHNHPVEPMH